MTVRAFRNAFLKGPQRSTCLKKARVARGQYQCAKCGHIGKQKEFAVDHIDPVIALDENHDNGYNYNKIFDRLWDDRNLQLLCKKPCHSDKTKRENSMRKKRWDGYQRRRHSKKMKTIRRVTEEEREYMRKRAKYNNPMKNPETVKRMQMTKRNNGGFDNPVLCVETNEIYRTQTEAGKAKNTDCGSIGYAIKYNRTAGGYTWKRIKKCLKKHKEELKA